MSTDYLTCALRTAPDAELTETVIQAVVNLLMQPAGPERDREQCLGAYAASYFAAVESGRLALWNEAAREARHMVRQHNAANFQRAKEICSNGNVPNCGQISDGPAQPGHAPTPP